MERQMSISFDGIDSDTPLNEKLSAKYIKSFAYYTVRDRLPVILTRVINDLVTNKGKIIQENKKQGTEEDLKSVIGQISKLKNELVTNKNFVKLTSKGDDVQDWNDYLESESKIELPLSCWYYSSWLYAECYMYRRLWEIFENSETLQNMDPFATAKEEAFYMSMPVIKSLADYVIPKLDRISFWSKDLEKNFVEFLKLSLWSNRCDLSLKYNQGSDENHIISVNSLDSCLLSDDSLTVFNHLKENSGGIIDFVTDNTAFEIFSDFCFCDFLCSSLLVSKVKFHVKKLPWFVSDATKKDVDWLLDALEKEGLKELTKRWREYFKEGIWSVYDEKYWTLPFDFNDMKIRDPELYDSLSKCKLVIFKGDLNSRKLLGDIKWNPCEPFEIVLRKFRPTSILSLRTVKSDLICGLPPGMSEELSKKDLMWMRTGEYAVIQFLK